ncbi:dehydrogenase [Mycobacterium sp. E3298]|uniref:zinc-binding dehydrogenase n=1 Tax=Mycobacterium sp. E3298 TaxID=1856865 RepID=UPI0007FFDDBB|nr:zinc-binding dehydrogenase [Mycobacterium sp. E3298]OBG84483.1 dehydrogenase [Mycobacterium sp. E3298]
MTGAAVDRRIDATAAAVWRGGDRIAVERVAVPPLGPADVLVRVRLATVCGSDRHTVSGRRAQPCPSILGHEAVGEIVAVGQAGRCDVDGQRLHPGQRVIWSVTLPCQTCDRCRAGVTAKCRTVRKAGHEALDSGWALSGSYAEYVFLPGNLAIAVVGDDLSDAVAAPAACATATVTAVIDRAGPLTGRRVIVVGVGMLGLSAVAAAASAGASVVTAVDPSAERRQLARQFGATDEAASAPDVDSCDVLLEFSGSSTALQAGLAALDSQGVAVLAGSVAPDAAIALDPEHVVRRQLSIFGVHNYEPRHLSAALSFLRATHDRFPWGELVARPRPLADVASLLVGSPGPSPRYSVAP